MRVHVLERCSGSARLIQMKDRQRMKKEHGKKSGVHER